MAVYTQELATDIMFPNISIYKKYKDTELCAYEVYPNDDYVMYDTTAEDYEIIDPDSPPAPTTYYYTWVTFPKTFDFSNFTWVAVLRPTVEENHIF